MPIDQPIRLTDHLAKRRLFYPSALISAPGALVIDVPVGSRGPGLALDRYYVAILESEAEVAEMERLLAEPRSVPVPPDLFDDRPSGLLTDTILVSRYDPPKQGWPWLSICRWPASFAAAGGDLGMNMARGCYTMEAFQTPAALEAHQAELLESLAREHSITVRTLSADRMPAPGTA